MAGVYRNTGAPWRRADGTLIERGAEFVPTDDERLRKAYKLQYLRPTEDEAPAVDARPLPRRVNVDDYDQGGGWYLIGGEKIQGRAAAEDAFRALLAAEQREREAYGLDGP